MLGFFDSFKKGCGCALGAMTGLVITLIIIWLIFGNWEIRSF